MNPDKWTVWHKPSGKRARWERAGDAADRRAAWSLMLADRRSGGWYVCAPGSPFPTPNREPTPIPRGEA